MMTLVMAQMESHGSHRLHVENHYSSKLTGEAKNDDFGEWEFRISGTGKRVKEKISGIYFAEIL